MRKLTTISKSLIFLKISCIYNLSKSLSKCIENKNMSVSCYFAWAKDDYYEKVIAVTVRFKNPSEELSRNVKVEENKDDADQTRIYIVGILMVDINEAVVDDGYIDKCEPLCDEIILDDCCMNS